MKEAERVALMSHRDYIPPAIIVPPVLCHRLSVYSRPFRSEVGVNDDSLLADLSHCRMKDQVTCEQNADTTASAGRFIVHTHTHTTQPLIHTIMSVYQLQSRLFP